MHCPSGQIKRRWNVKRCTILAGVILVVMIVGGAAYGQGKTAQAAGQGKININTATIEEFQLLPKVGEATAKNILDFRKAHGSFKSVDDLEKVKGIGKKKLQSLRPYIKIDGKSDFEPTKQKSFDEKRPTS
jgi:comEA protein